MILIDSQLAVGAYGQRREMAVRYIPETHFPFYYNPSPGNQLTQQIHLNSFRKS